jgi:hypothetical protein
LQCPHGGVITGVNGIVCQNNIVSRYKGSDGGTNAVGAGAAVGIAIAVLIIAVLGSYLIYGYAKDRSIAPQSKEPAPSSARVRENGDFAYSSM